MGDGTRLWVLGLAIVTLVSACAGPPSGPRTASDSPAEGAGSAGAPRQQTKRLVLGVRGTAQVLANKLNIGNAGLGVQETERMVHAGLAVQDDQDALHPVLAEAVPSIENGLWTLLPDGRMETTVRIRQGAEWHDGMPFTTDDLLFTARVAQNRDIPILRDRIFESIERIETPDARTLKVTWSRLYIQADTLFSLAGGANQPSVPPLPRHLLESAYQQDRANFHQIPYWTTEFVGMGPYRLRAYDRDVHAILVANDRFVLGRPNIDEIEVKFIPDRDTIVANILAGAVDMTLDPRTITFAQAMQIKDRWRDGQIAYARSTWVVMFPQFINPTPAAVADARFRRALLHAIDRQDIVDTMQLGVGGVAHHYIGPDWDEFKHVEPSIVKYDFDQRRAAQMLAEMGYGKDPDGMYRDAAGQRFTIEIRTTGVDINSKSSFTVADNWQRFGIPAEVAIVPPQRTNEREYRSTFPAFELIRPTATVISFEAFRGSEVPLPETNWAGANRSRYRNAEMDRLIDQYFATIPPAERLLTLSQIVHHMTDQLVQLGVVRDPPVRLIGNRVRNARAGIVWDSHLWDVAG